jgi:hypothetical protein
MGNPCPNESTRFKPGRKKTGGRGPGVPNRHTVLQRAPRIRSLEEVLADENAFRGSMAQMLESVARDGDQSIDIRLSCANAVVRLDGPAHGGEDSATGLPPSCGPRSIVSAGKSCSS